MSKHGSAAGIALIGTLAAQGTTTAWEIVEPASHPPPGCDVLVAVDFRRDFCPYT